MKRRKIKNKFFADLTNLTHIGYYDYCSERDCFLINADIRYHGDPRR